MARERPWMKFYPADWRADPMLRNCGLLARGLWVEILALCHESERYGRLLVNGKAPTERQLAVQVGATIDEVRDGLAELESEGVFSRDREGIIYSRRMRRDEKKSNLARKTGRMGGNPKLLEQTENPASDKPALTEGDNGPLKTHMPEAREKDKTSVLSQKTRLPDDWKPEPFGEGTESRKIVDGWSSDELRRQIEAFTAHHAANGSKFTNWQKAWSTWALNSVAFNRGGRPAPPTKDDFVRHYAEELASGRVGQ
jgi:hypothetical protein